MAATRAIPKPISRGCALPAATGSSATSKPASASMWHGSARALLIVRPNWVGDMVMAEPVVSALSRARPDRTVDMLAPPHVLEVAARMPDIGALIPLPFSPHAPHFGPRWALGRTLPGRYETAVILPNSFLSALVPWFAGVPERRGYRTELRHLLVNRPVRETIRAAAGCHSAPISMWPGVTAAAAPRLRVDQAQQAEALQRFGLREGCSARCFRVPKVGRRSAGRSRVLGPCAALAGRRARGGCARRSARPRRYGAVCRDAPGAVSMGGRTRLGLAVDLIAAARGAVGNDTGLMHVAAATGVPVLGLYGPTAPDETPLSALGATISLGLPCAPCRARTCPLGHRRCMSELLPQMVMARFAEPGRAAAIVRVLW